MQEVSIPDQLKDFTLRCVDKDGEETYSVKTSLLLLWRISGYFKRLFSFDSTTREVVFKDVGRKHVDVIVHYAETGRLLQLLLDRTEFVELLDRFELSGNIPSYDLVTLGEEKLNEVEGLFMLLSINERMERNAATMHLSLATPIISRFIKKMTYYGDNNDSFHSFVPKIYFYEEVLKVYKGDQSLIKELVEALEQMIKFGGIPIEKSLAGVDLCELVAKMGAESSVLIVKMYFEFYLDNGIPIPDEYKLMFFNVYTSRSLIDSLRKKDEERNMKRFPGVPLHIPGAPQLGAPLHPPVPQLPGHWAPGAPQNPFPQPFPHAPVPQQGDY